MLGTWYLSGTTVYLSDLMDSSCRSRDQLPPTGQSNSGSSENDNTRYVFDMTLKLRSRPLGRWNILDIKSYDSVNLETGDNAPVALKHERPFWFSKVRSYAPEDLIHKYVLAANTGGVYVDYIPNTYLIVVRRIEGFKYQILE